ncbi:helix-turn-helix domain-containing protein [Laspinema olomoucense]|uniref:Helix-turn-helix domain-containing protein n=1 Tax=Laspinema olomoucense D3b TaxID=2953688 RepID=A0ABT2N1S0_9CYAN|nr:MULTISPECIES: helix-turn-helix transcriptional regulator [unclassified Laspinema]MCT7972791.1 helix-turn-helix domain-containing protein [Laspinema sp. D3d]MCT7976629.1 helix-turn-helix domain-containing protein [Laspinema sp. D3b]MCT7990123.1 helix-turn-helix domain-containing protein [Laspinema sp. D3a]
MNEKIEVKASSGNIFSDLGLENADELLVKAKLAHQITSIITQHDMTQAEAAIILGIDQPTVSALINGKLLGFSTERLFRFLNALGRDVEIRVKVKPPSRSQAETRVVT